MLRTSDYLRVKAFNNEGSAALDAMKLKFLWLPAALYDSVWCPTLRGSGEYTGDYIYCDHWGRYLFLVLQVRKALRIVCIV